MIVLEVAQSEEFEVKVMAELNSTPITDCEEGFIVLNQTEVRLMIEQIEYAVSAIAWLALPDFSLIAITVIVL